MTYQPFVKQMAGRSNVRTSQEHKVRLAEVYGECLTPFVKQMAGRSNTEIAEL